MSWRMRGGYRRGNVLVINPFKIDNRWGSAGMDITVRADLTVSGNVTIKPVTRNGIRGLRIWPFRQQSSHAQQPHLSPLWGVISRLYQSQVPGIDQPCGAWIFPRFWAAHGGEIRQGALD